jgi:predicted kinase
MLVLMAGLPGSGKSTLARAVASEVDGLVIDKDEVRSALFHHAVEYSREQDDFVMRLTLEAAAWHLLRHSGTYVFIDGRPFSRTSQIDDALASAESAKLSWRIVECICSQESARDRLTQSHPAANRSYELRQQIAAEWEEITRPKLVVNTDRSLQQCANDALTYLRGT